MSTSRQIAAGDVAAAVVTGLTVQAVGGDGIVITGGASGAGVTLASVSPAANSPIFITPKGALSYLFFGPTGGSWPGIDGLPTSSVITNTIFRTSGDATHGGNVFSIQNLVSTAYSAINAANENGYELGAWGVGNTSSDSNYAGRTFWESLSKLAGPAVVTTTITTNSTVTATVASATGLVSGMAISSANVPAGTYITGISGTTLTLSAAATATAGPTAVTFIPFTEQVVLGTVETLGIRKRMLFDKGGRVVIYDGHTSAERITVDSNGFVTVTSGLISLKGQVTIDGNSAAGSFAVGPNAPTISSNNQFTFGSDSIGLMNMVLQNATSGIGAATRFLFNAGTTGGSIAAYSQGYTTSGSQAASSVVLSCGSAGGVNILAEHASGPIGFYTGGVTNLRGQFTAAGSFVMGSAAIATNATAGFFYIASCAGTPTGTPTAQTGRVPMVWDSTNKKFYIYDGAWLGGTAPGAFS